MENDICDSFHILFLVLLSSWAGNVALQLNGECY